MVREACSINGTKFVRWREGGEVEGSICSAVSMHGTLCSVVTVQRRGKARKVSSGARPSLPIS